MAESPKIRTHKINPLGQDPFLRLVWAVLTVLGWLLLFAFLMRLAGCGRPDAATADNGTYYGEPPVAPDDWIEVPPAVTDDWTSGGDRDAIVWDELPNADASDAIRDYWLEPPAQVVDLPEDAWEVDEDDPLGRKVASGIVNLYVTKESNLKGLSLQIAQAFPNTVLALASSADEYKRLTFEVEEDHKAYFKSRVRTVFPEVQFVFDESELTTATLESVILEGDDAWPWREIGAADLWKHTHGDSSIVVAVIDNMFETDHPELDGKQVSNWDVAGFDSQWLSSRDSGWTMNPPRTALMWPAWWRARLPMELALAVSLQRPGSCSFNWWMRKRVMTTSRMGCHVLRPQPRSGRD